MSLGMNIQNNFRRLLQTLAILFLVQSAYAQLPSLIRRKVLFDNPDRTAPLLSPNGMMIAYIKPLNGVQNIWIRSMKSESDSALTSDTARGIRRYLWAEDNRHILFLQDNNGDENWKVFSIDIRTKKTVNLTPFDNINAEVVGTNRKDPSGILVGANLRDRRLHDAYRIDILTGEKNLIAENPGDVISWYADNNFKVRLCLAQTSDGGYVLRTRVDEHSDWKTAGTWSLRDGAPTIFGFTSSDDSIYAGDARSSNTARLVRIALSDGGVTTIASDSAYDIHDVMLNPVDHHLEAFSFYSDRRDWSFLDSTIWRSFKKLEYFDGDLSMQSRDGNDSIWLIKVDKDNWPVEYRMVNRFTHEIMPLFVERPALDKYLLAGISSITYPARDGRTIHGYIAFPHGLAPDSLPLVVLVHGGPWERDEWGFNPIVQWLANRGYVILQANFRGSSGYGKDFLNAGDREWGGKMQDDISDGVAWAVNEGIADPGRVAIFGGSYGGYAALAGAAFTPNLYKCAIDLFGPGNLAVFLKSIPSYRESEKKFFYERVGDPAKDGEVLKSRSPFFNTDRITVPLLIGQGASDPRVNQSESDEIVNALKARGKPVEYILFPDEGHGFTRPRNRLKFYEAAEEFLGKHLGGRVE